MALGVPWLVGPSVLQGLWMWTPASDLSPSPAVTELQQAVDAECASIST